jgi:hypothetical protein
MADYIKDNLPSIVLLFCVILFLNFYANNGFRIERFDVSGDFYKNASKFISLDFLVDPKTGNMRNLQWNTVKNPDLRNLTHDFDFKKSTVKYGYERDLDDQFYFNGNKKLTPIPGAEREKSIVSDLGAFRINLGDGRANFAQEGQVLYTWDTATGKKTKPQSVWSGAENKFIPFDDYVSRYGQPAGLTKSEKFGSEDPDFRPDYILSQDDNSVINTVDPSNALYRYEYGRSRYVDEPGYQNKFDMAKKEKMVTGTLSIREDYRDNNRSLNRMRNQTSRYRKGDVENFIEGAAFFSDKTLEAHLNRAV